MKYKKFKKIFMKTIISDSYLRWLRSRIKAVNKNVTKEELKIKVASEIVSKKTLNGRIRDCLRKHINKLRQPERYAKIKAEAEKQKKKREKEAKKREERRKRKEKETNK